jgi:hypothetical protein
MGMAAAMMADGSSTPETKSRVLIVSEVPIMRGHLETDGPGSGHGVSAANYAWLSFVMQLSLDRQLLAQGYSPVTCQSLALFYQQSKRS